MFSLYDVHQALTFISEYDFFDIDCRDIFSMSKKEEKKLDRACSFYANIEMFKDAKPYKFDKLSRESINAIALFALKDMFPSFESKINYLAKKVSYKKTKNNSGLVFDIRRGSGKYDILEIEVSNSKNATTVVDAVHEITHGMYFFNVNKKDACFYSSELFPFIVEKIVIETLENRYGFSDLKRFNSIDRFNNTGNAIYEYKLSREIEKDLEYGVEPSEYLETSFKDEEEDLQMVTAVKEYLRIEGLKYILAELYSNLMIENYKDNKEEVLNMLRRVMDGKLKLEYFHDYFDLNINNERIIPVTKKITDLTRKSYTL